MINIIVLDTLLPSEEALALFKSMFRQLKLFVITMIMKRIGVLFCKVSTNTGCTVHIFLLLVYFHLSLKYACVGLVINVKFL